MDHELTRFPPVLQLLALGLLAAYVLASVVGRLSDSFDWLWDEPEAVRSPAHVVQYTVLPACVLFAAAVAVYLNWDPGASLTGGWSIRQLTLGPIAALLGIVLVALASTIRKRGGWVASGGSPWVLFLALVVGMALMAVGIFSLGRTMKKIEREQKARASAIHLQTR
jgi:hypothetical protein